MTVLFQISAIAVITAICGYMIRSCSGTLSVVLSVASCVALVIMSLQFFGPVAELMMRMQKLSGMSGAMLSPLIKVLGIGLLAQISGAICEDAGDKAMAQTVEIAAMLLALYVSTPLFSAVLDILEDILSG